MIGSDICGIASAIRLQTLGFDTTILEQLDDVGGRAYVRRARGFTFDMGPTVLTVPHCVEELFSLERDMAMLTAPDFPENVLTEGQRILSGVSGGPNTSRYLDIAPVLPFYGIYFNDGSFFDYDADPVNLRAQIARLAPEDLDGYDRFHEAAPAIFQRGLLELGYLFRQPGVDSEDRPRPVEAWRGAAAVLARRQVFQERQYAAGVQLRSAADRWQSAEGARYLCDCSFRRKDLGVHYAMGGTSALVRALVVKFDELGGTVKVNAKVARIDVEKRGGERVATGMTLASGETLAAGLVVSNTDHATTYLKLIGKAHRRIDRDAVVKFRKQSMSLMVIYFGYAKRNGDPDVRHRNIILGPRYEELLTDIFERKIVAKDFSKYLHIPMLTDPSLAPPDHHTAYTLIPVPNTLGDMVGEGFVQKVPNFLDDRGYIPGLRERLVYRSFVTPDYFEQVLGAYAGNGFGVEPRLTQTAFFRPHNCSEDIANLHPVGQGTQPGGGTPSVMMSAKMTAREIARDYVVDPRILAGMPV